MKFTVSICILLSSYFMSQAQDFCGTVPPPGYMESFYAKDKSYLSEIGARGTDAITYVPIQYHIIGSDAGTGYFSIKDLMEIHCILNERYAGANIQFFMYDVPNYIKSTRFYTMSDGSVDRDMKNANNVTNACNVYIVQNAISSGTSVCGYATFPGSGRQGIVVAKSCMDVDNTTLTHEMGHFLGLAHTFSGWEGRNPLVDPATSTDEKVNGSNCSTRGDGFCGTPADFYSDRWSCPYTGSKTDFNGDYYNTVHPEIFYMSYSSDACQTAFSSDQQVEMYQVRTTQRTNFNSVPVPSFVLPSSTSLLSPMSGATSLSPSVSFSWNRAVGATHYHLLISTVSSFALNNVKDTIMSDTNYTATGLNTSTTYYWKVQPITLGNTCGNYTEANSFVTSALNAIPSISPVSCPQGNDGVASITIIGGTLPYSFTWSSGEGYNPIIEKTAGTYSVTVTDAGGRIVIADVIIPQPANFDIGIFPTGSQLAASAVGGTGPLTYAWSNGDIGQIINAPVGDITVTITDANGCTASKSFYYTGISILSDDLLSGVSIYPNPAMQEDVTLETTVEMDVKGEAKVYTSEGTLVLSKNLELRKGKNITKLDTHLFSAGIYILKLNGENFTKSLRFLVSK